MSVYGFDGGYAGFNFAAPPGYAPMGGHWPGVHPARGAPVQMTYSASSNHAGAGMQGGAYSGYNGYQSSSRLGERSQMVVKREVPARAMYNGRPINSSNASDLFAQERSSRQAPQQRTSSSQYSQHHRPSTSYQQRAPYVVQNQSHMQPNHSHVQTKQTAPQPQVQRAAPVPPSPPRPQQQQQTRQQQQHPAPQTTSERKVYSTQVIAQRQAQPSNQQPQQPLPQRQYQQQPVSYSRPEAMKDPERTPVPARELHPSYGQRQPSSHALELTRGAQPSASTTAVYSAQRSGQSTYSTGIKLREIRGVGLQVIRLTAGSSAMLSGQISEGDMLASINGTLVPQYGYDLNVIRDMLAGVRGSRVTLGFKSKFGQEYEVDLVRNVRSTKTNKSASAVKQPRPTSWQVQDSHNTPPPAYEGFAGGSLAGGSVVDQDSYTPSIAIGEMEEDM